MCKDEQNKLKLYVWEGVLTDYTDGIMFALAGSVGEARELILKADKCVRESELKQEPQVFDSPIGFALWGGA